MVSRADYEQTEPPAAPRLLPCPPSLNTPAQCERLLVNVYTLDVGGALPPLQLLRLTTNHSASLSMCTIPPSLTTAYTYTDWWYLSIWL